MAGWGNSSWGGSPWGAGAAAPVVVVDDGVVRAADVLYSNAIRVRFEDDMKNDYRLQSVSSYIIEPDGDGRAVAVKLVEAGNVARTNEVILYVTPVTVGATYTVTVAGPKTAKGGSMSLTENTAQFIGRITKTDNALESTTRVYDTRPGSIFRSVLIAITKEDDRIGGTRNDSLPAVDD